MSDLDWGTEVAGGTKVATYQTEQEQKQEGKPR